MNDRPRQNPAYRPVPAFSPLSALAENDRSFPLTASLFSLLHCPTANILAPPRYSGRTLVFL
ncbi:hypothetical protein BN874_160031 [Candidatus Contendobacter odensis Run_B_J11]|uniref:Uncharacterized protein n=1 Tax=Candidatus Contendobacter odensis Run_B_J11 TaxID=1400861 RepID=A0A7U7G9C9_9GAMM|nr:hypothetical protein BN874_160031 [Candidatus Contendobacter odensis Run_B_J11]